MTIHRAVRRSTCVLCLAAAAVCASPARAQSPAIGVGVGVDTAATELALARGLNVRYGSFWVGSWTQRYGWGYAEEQLRASVARNVTPVVQWWYWGDDISPQCVEQGCRDARQNVWKDRATWYRMTEELAALIQRAANGRETIVIVETEFNKGGIETYEPFDGYLADQIAILRRYGNIRTVVSFGNWGREHWGRFDRAIAAADFLGLEALRSSVRNASTYAATADMLMASARSLQSAYRKPILVTDLALSSFPAPVYETFQSDVVAQLFEDRLAELEDAGVRAILYRMLVDDPSFDTNNYHGEAERHWGLLRADRSAKPAFERMVAGLRAKSCAAAVAPSVLAVPAGGGGFQVQLAIHDGCAWTAGSASTGVAAVTPASGTGTAAIRITVAANTTAAERSAQLMIAGVTLQVRQAAATRGRGPRNLGAVAQGANVTLSWDAPEDPAGLSGYVIEAGSTSGATDVGVMPAGGTTISFAGVPDGIYFVRVRAVHGTRNLEVPEASNEVVVAVNTRPGAPAGLAAAVQGSLVTLTWLAPAGTAPQRYLIEAFDPAGRPLAILDTRGPATTWAQADVPPGVYVVRVRAVTAAGVGDPSTSVILGVGR